MTATELSTIPTVLPLAQQHVKLREALPADFPVILELLTRCGLHTSSVTPEGSTYWIADLNGVPGGCIGLEHGQGVSLISLYCGAARIAFSGVGPRSGSQRTHAGQFARRPYRVPVQSGGRRLLAALGFVPTGGDELSAALNDAPQVKSGLCRGWIHEEQAWKLTLIHQESVQQESAGQ